MRAALITVHAATALAAFLLGWRLVRTSRQRPSPGGSFAWYAGALATSVLALGAALIVDWHRFATGPRIGFSVLGALAAFMVWRAWCAGAVRGRASIDERRRFIDHIGFTLIALFDGFLIVGAIDLGAPPWLVALAGLAGIAAGHRAVSAAQAAVVADPGLPGPTPRVVNGLRGSKGASPKA